MKIEKLHHLFLEANQGISKDTRSINNGDLYFALKGGNFNGNLFADDAIEKGAAYAIVDENIDSKYPKQIILVEDTLLTLQKLANFHRKQFNIPIIGITGSNGKTTTKELFQAVLSTEYNITATIGNLNNHIGVPLTLLRINNNTEIGIIEMGANKPGDIQELVDITEPTHGIITNIGKAHLEGFGGFEGVLNTKKALSDYIIKTNGTMFHNQDDDVTSSLLDNYNEKVSFGKSNSDFITGEIIEASPTLKLKYISKEYNEAINSHLFGAYNFDNILAAICAGVYFNVSKDKINSAIENYIPSNNRSQVEKSENNTIIWDAYNANPTSMTFAIKSLSEANGQEKLAILGDMKEVGQTTEVEHEAIIKLLNDLNIDVITVGQNFKKANTKNLSFENTDALIQYLKAKPILNKLILVKGSRSIGLEKIKNWI